MYLFIMEDFSMLYRRKARPYQTPAYHLPKEAGLDGGREPFLKDPEQITQLPGMQCSVQQGKAK